MDTLETYSLLFADNLMDALLLPPHTAYIFKVMLGFGGFSPWLMLICASFGAMLGMLANWLLGRMLITCRDKEWVIAETPKLDKWAANFRKYGAWLLLLSWLPGIGGLIALVAGFSKVKFWMALLFTGVGTVAYYMYIIY